MIWKQNNLDTLSFQERLRKSIACYLSEIVLTSLVCLDVSSVEMIQVFYIPFDDDLDIFDEPDGLLAVSGMCVNSALKKLYSCSIIRENWKKREMTNH